MNMFTSAQYILLLEDKSIREEATQGIGRSKKKLVNIIKIISFI